ncbi:Na(+)/H(+) antiporter subunit F [Aquimixticola soesokkakensis]|uniref:Na(+)/H(+) antiporter subunit F n=1 Tax=Aquimixticola soesokkakensis TaxID=1519096 RepID=A0A1Y5RSH3_9RHOB|nr:monovalent cation/H+ antiporter complex subunit F [Aquimixticola soesokkakensis]SLN24437.1 Na(+)/H(+) antiporter subunit F [Aquimixticola soesokkakensis]
MTPEVFLFECAVAGIGMITLAVAIAFFRLAKGPSFADRVIALDMMTVAIVAFAAVYAVLTGDSAFIDVVIVLALVGFLSVVALARFAERRQIQISQDANPQEEHS